MGLLDLLGVDSSWLDGNRNKIMGLGSGIAGSSNWQQAAQRIGPGLQQGAQPDSAYQVQMKQDQERQAAIQQQAQQKNQTVEWLTKNNMPDLAEAFQLGIVDGNGLFAEIQRRQQGPEQQALLNAGNGNIYDPNSKAWLQAPGSGQSMPESVVALQERAKLAGLQPGTPQFNEFIISGGRAGTSLSVGPDGTVSFQQGMAGGKPLTEAQSKDNVYSIRAQGVAPILDDVGTELTNPVAGAANADPTGVVRSWLQSPAYQRADQAGKEFLASVLRKDTGAAVTPTEFDMYGRIFLPMPGDSKEVIEQKKQARARAIRAINQGLPPAAVIMQAQAIDGSAPAAGGVVDYTTYFGGR